MGKSIIISSFVIGIFIVIAVIANSVMEQERITRAEEAKQQKIEACLNQAQKDFQIIDAGITYQGPDSLCAQWGANAQQCEEYRQANISGLQKRRERCYLQNQ